MPKEWRSPKITNNTKIRNQQNFKARISKESRFRNWNLVAKRWYINIVAVEPGTHHMTISFYMYSEIRYFPYRYDLISRFFEFQIYFHLDPLNLF